MSAVIGIEERMIGTFENDHHATDGSPTGKIENDDENGNPWPELNPPRSNSDRFATELSQTSDFSGLTHESCNYGNIGLLISYP